MNRHPLQQVMSRVVVAGAVMLTATFAATEPAAAAVVGPQLVDAQLSTDHVAVAGLDVVMVEADVHLTATEGVCGTCTDMAGGRYPAIVLARSDGLQDVRILVLSAGSATDGTWSAEIRVPSTYDGDWRVSRVQALDTKFQLLDVDPATQGIDRTLHVTGTHQPRLSFGFAPQPVLAGQLVSVKGRLTFADTGEPIPNQRLSAGRDSSCAEAPVGGIPLVTNANGYYSFSYAADPFLACLFLISPPSTSFDPTTVATIAWRSGVPDLRYVVSAVPTAASTVAGHSIQVNGKVWPLASNHSVLLQRWTASGWRNVARGTVRSSGRYTVLAVPPWRGTFRFRVVKPADPPHLFAGISRVFFLVGR